MRKATQKDIGYYLSFLYNRKEVNDSFFNYIMLNVEDIKFSNFRENKDELKTISDGIAETNLKLHESRKVIKDYNEKYSKASMMVGGEEIKKAIKEMKADHLVKHDELLKLKTNYNRKRGVIMFKLKKIIRHSVFKQVKEK